MNRDMLLKNIEDAYKKLGKEIPNGLSAKEYFKNLTDAQLGAKLRELVFEIDHPQAEEVTIEEEVDTIGYVPTKEDFEEYVRIMEKEAEQKELLMKHQEEDPTWDSVRNNDMLADEADEEDEEDEMKRS